MSLEEFRTTSLIMKAVSLLSIAAILFGQEIEGHGYVQQLRINGAQYFTTVSTTEHSNPKHF